MDIVNLIIALVSGAVGGNIAGAAMTDKNLGPVVNTIAGLVGGGAGDFILKAFGIISAASASGHMDISQILATIGASGVSGGVITAIITAIKDAMEKK